MKELKDYLFLVPVWMREDESFYKFYTSIINVLLDCQLAKDKILESFTMKEIANYDKSLEALASYFGINRNFYLASGDLVTSINIADWTYTYTANTVINISIPNDVLFRLIKFKLLQSNFDGTRKSIIENFQLLFGEEISIQFIESTVLKDNITYPVLNLNLVLDERISLEEATLFINGAYSFNYLGVVTIYSLGGRTIELIWDESEWDNSKWKT